MLFDVFRFAVKFLFHAVFGEVVLVITTLELAKFHFKPLLE